MWKRHKEIYGNKCDKNCPCPSDLKRLTGNVVMDFLRKQVKKAEGGKGSASNAHLSRVGFVDYFVPKFYKKVQDEFPDSTPAQVLEKLIAMWPKHKETLRFGINCSESCPCGEGWKLPQKQARITNAVSSSNLA
eukprot:14258933-Ditylum_brightwellii.AAC.1